RHTISVDVKTKVVETLDELRATVRRMAGSHPAFLELDLEIGCRSTEVQRALDDAAGWFTHIDLEGQRKFFTLTQVVRVATDSALKCQRAFDPVIDSVVEGDAQLTTNGLVFIHDVIFVALDNVRAHSGLRRPNVSIRVTADTNSGLVTIEVTSDTRVQN